MVSDDERSEVAERLREVNPYRNQSYTVPYNRYTPAAEYLSELAEALGCSPENDVSRLEFQNRLADLIEPSESGQNRDRNQDTVSKESPAVQIAPEFNREALLALAEEMQGYADGAASGDGFPYVNAGSLWSYADRIREALGASDD